MKKHLSIIIVSCLCITAYAKKPIDDRPGRPDRPDMEEQQKPPFDRGRMEHRKAPISPFEKALWMLENRPEIADQLGISEEQLSELKQLRKSSKQETAPLQKQLMQARKALGKLIGSGEATEAEIMSAIEKAGELEIQMKKEHIRTMLQVREIIGQEVFQKIHKRAADRGGDREAMREKIRNQREKFQQGDGPDGEGPMRRRPGKGPRGKRFGPDGEELPPWMKVE